MSGNTISLKSNTDAPVVDFDEATDYVPVVRSGNMKRARGSTLVPGDATVTDAKIPDDAGISAAKVAFKHKDDASFSRPLYKRLREKLSIKDIDAAVTGEAGDDCTAYLQEFLEELRTRKIRGTMPIGTYDFSEPLDGLYGDGFTLIGDNKFATWLNYTGPVLTSADDYLVRLGTPDYASSGYIARGFGVKSQTELSIGFTCRVENAITADVDLRLDDGATRNCYGGFRLLNSNYINLLSSESATSGPKIAASDVVQLYCPETKVFGQMVAGVGSGGGVIMGGGVGGLYWGGSLLLCEGGILVDRSLSTNGNTQIFVNMSDIDSCRDYLIKFDDDVSGTVPKFAKLSGWLGTCNAGEAIWFKNWKDGKARLSGGGIVNIGGNGVRIDDASVRPRIDDSYTIAEIFARPGVPESGYGIYASVPIVLDTRCKPENCATEPFSPNVTITNTASGTTQFAFDPTKTWAFDGSTATSTVVVPAGGSVNLPDGSGVIWVSHDASGDTAAFETGGGGIDRFTRSGTTWIEGPPLGASPGPTEISIAFDGTHYKLYSGFATDQAVNVIPLLKLRASN